MAFALLKQLIDDLQTSLTSKRKMLLKCAISCLLLLFIIVAVKSYLYSHNPRGSNNRLNEKTPTRVNGARLFDSQNNKRGGYNVGDATIKAASKIQEQYQMKYFQSSSKSRINSKKGQSYLKLEWSTHDGCGINSELDPNKRQCNLVLQYMCQKMSPDDDRDRLRDGLTIKTQSFVTRSGDPQNIAAYNKYKNIVKMDIGLHESWDWYDKCYQRKRNAGLFTADKNLHSKEGYERANTTRQNSQGYRRGYECPEERDYYPYWHPTPWLDIAIFAQKPEYCPYYIKNSFNVHKYGECVEFYPDGTRKHSSRWNNEAQCKRDNKTWIEFSSYLEKAPQYKTYQECVKARKIDKINYVWGIPWDAKYVNKKECLVPAEAPLCSKAAYSRVNNLGEGVSGEMNSFLWKLPHFPSNNEMRCVYRIRYNISTDDYDPFNTTSAQNKNVKKGIRSPVEMYPVFNFVGQPLRLAINTAQFGRVFQDRSHIFHLIPRPKGVTQNIHNLNVRGKRGSIRQVFPALEYDFVPNSLTISSNDLVHIQWTGSNTHNNANDEIDGIGRAGTDRNNLMQTKRAAVSYPLPFKDTTLWNNSKIIWIYHNQTNIGPEDLAINLASSGYYTCVKSSKCPPTLVADSFDKKGNMSIILDNAPASYKGVLLSIKKGNYFYMNTRNTYFSYRSQRGIIRVK